MLHIFVDADACPVKQEVYRVAGRHNLPVTLVANSHMRIPEGERFTLQVVASGSDKADNWIAENVTPGDIVITADILLAGRCLSAGAAVIGSTGKPFTEDNIGQAVAIRNLLADLRGGSENLGGGPPPMQQRDRSRFLQELENTIQAIRRA